MWLRRGGIDVLVMVVATPFARGGSADVAERTPLDRVVALELAADDPELIEGRGPVVVAEYGVTLHVGTSSEIGLCLQVDDAGEGVAARLGRRLGRREDALHEARGALGRVAGRAAGESPRGERRSRAALARGRRRRAAARLGRVGADGRSG